MNYIWLNIDIDGYTQKYLWIYIYIYKFPISLVAQTVESAHHMGDPDLIHGLGRFPREENGNLFQYTCLENPMDGGAWQVIVHGAPKS